MTSLVGTMYYACPEIVQHFKYNEKAGEYFFDFPLNRIFSLFLIDIWSLGCVLYHMVALVPPFHTQNMLALARKICAGEYDQNPLKSYSDRIRQIVAECLTVNPTMRPDICAVAQLCTEQIMLYTDRSCTTIQTLEKRLRPRDNQHELYLLRQQSQLQQQLSSHQHQRCLSCSSAKESLVNSSGGITDVNFDGIDNQQDSLKQDTFTATADSDTIENIPSNAIPQPPTNGTRSNSIRRQTIRLSSEPSVNSMESKIIEREFLRLKIYLASICPARSPESSNVSFDNGYESNNIPQGIHHSLSLSNMERK